MQNPLFVSVSALIVADSTFCPEPMSWRNWDRLDAAFARHRFFVDFRRCADADAVLPSDPNGVQILEGLSFDGALFAQTRFDPVPLQVFLDQLPDTTAVREGKERNPRAEKNDKDAVIKSLPWLAKIWKRIDRSQEDPLAEAEPNLRAGEEADPSAEMDDDEVAAIFDELERRRKALAEDFPLPGDDFKVKLLGSTWTLENVGVSADCVQARAAHQLANEFCYRRGYPKTARFEIATYTEGNAAIMARGWAHRMQFFYDREVAYGRPGKKFDANDHNAYQEPTELTRLYNEWVGKHRQGVNRILGIRKMFV